MTEIQPTTVYTGLSFEWLLPPPSGRLNESYARRALAVEDLLENAPGFYEDDGCLVEGRRLEIEDLEFSWPDDGGKVWGKLTVEQSKSPLNHDFSLRIEMPIEDNSRGVVDLIWGVDDPQDQVICVALEELNDEGAWVPVSGDATNEFSAWDKKLIDNLLEASLKYEGKHHG